MWYMHTPMYTPYIGPYMEGIAHLEVSTMRKYIGIMLTIITLAVLEGTVQALPMTIMVGIVTMVCVVSVYKGCLWVNEPMRTLHHQQYPTVYTLYAVPSHVFYCEGERYFSTKPYDWAAVEAFMGDIEAGDWRSLV